MSIRRRLLLTVLACAVLAVVVGLLGWRAVHRLRQAQDGRAAATVLSEQVFSLALLTRDYLQEPSPAARQQWQRTVDDIEAILATGNDDGDAAATIIADARAALTGLRQQDNRLHAVADPPPAHRQAIATEMFASLREISAHAYRWQRRNEAATRDETARLTHEAVAGMALLLVVLIAASIYVAGTVLAPLDRLRRELSHVGAGGLDHRVSTGRTDEIGELEKEFDSMTARLAQTMASRDELQREVTQRKQAEVEREERLKELRCLYQATTVLADRRLQIPAAMQQIVELLPAAWLHEDVARGRIRLGRHEVFSADYRAPVAAQIAPIRAGGDIVGEIEVGYIEARPVQTDGPFLAQERQLLDSLARSLGHWLGHKEDLVRSEERFRQLLALAPLPLAHVDANGAFIYLNNRFTETFGYTIEELPDIQAWWTQAYPDADYRRQVVETWAADVEGARQTGTDIASRDCLVTGKDGSQRTMEVGGVVIGRELLTIFIDRTERQAVEARLQTSIRQLQRSNEELEQFAYVASHDLQEPLRGIAGCLQLLEDRYRGQLDDSADEFIDHAVRGSERMQALIQDLLRYSRVGTRGHEPVPTAMAEVLATAIENLSVAIHESGAEVESHDLPRLTADQRQMVQLLQNLIGNAIKFRAPDRPPRICVAASEDGDCWHFTVADNGIGIGPEYRERIFVIFQRLHKRREYAGTGMGLAICKKIVQRHGGDIWVESAGDGGSIFHFTISKQIGDEDHGQTHHAP